VGYQIDRLRIPVIPFDAEDAKFVASMRKATRESGLSLGDWACMSMGLKIGVPVLTAERARTKVNVGADVGVIR
jgi:ribonuclease VapC